MSIPEYLLAIAFLALTAEALWGSVRQLRGERR